MAEICPGCGKSFRNLRNHLAQSNRCPAALEYQPKPQEPGSIAEPIVEDHSEPLVESQGEPQPAGITEAEVRTLLAEAIGEAVTQVSQAVNARLEAEHQATQQQFEKVGPAILTYLQEQAAKEREQALAHQAASPAPPAGEQATPQGGDGLAQLANILSMFTKSSGGGLEQVAETLGSIGKLADAMDNLRYRPWKDGYDFAANSIYQQTRAGKTAEEAAQTLQQSSPNWAKNPRLTPETKP